MTQEEEQILRQQVIIEKQRAEITALKKRAEDLQRMHDANQRHISALTRKLDAGPRDLAERVFGGE